MGHADRVLALLDTDRVEQGFTKRFGIQDP
jgi:hypothetical protein